MPPFVLADVLATLTTLIAILTLVVGGLATLFSVIYLSRRALQRRTVQARLRAGVAASILLIGLAALTSTWQPGSSSPAEGERADGSIV